MPSDLQVTNLKANDGTAGLVIADSTGQVTGTLGSATVFPAGHVLQTLLRTKNDESSAVQNSNSYSKVVDSSGNAEWYGAITPASGNKVLINFNFVAYVAQTDANDGVAFCIYRENTIILQHTNKHSLYHGDVNSTHNFYAPVHLCFLDETPGGDGSTEIKYFLGSSDYDTSGVQIHSASTGQPFVSVLQEIKG